MVKFGLIYDFYLGKTPNKLPNQYINKGAYLQYNKLVMLILEQFFNMEEYMETAKVSLLDSCHLAPFF